MALEAETKAKLVECSSTTSCNRCEFNDGPIIDFQTKVHADVSELSSSTIFVLCCCGAVK
ncbi:hypothetical protein EMCRGX_G029787 [Ephydatia muelleri]